MAGHRWQVYIILGDDGRYYTGITTDVVRRWKEHRSGPRGARYFRGRQPRQLCYLELHPDRSSASRREYAIKQLSRTAKEQLIASAPAPAIDPEAAE
ncbi:GIY-YIG nuclease family protein [Marinimicrobium sp. C6131]|uniref:GIY-YIG nuclease family protein n=1 Tax=Marinimicrobium sp. C6131 TaxID=3022676 RepID=UPI00223D1A19|nr:GIY-YIG nuclease family protein [Marinimicrobium sp. C6131]UZJ45553.1 GIY-YIG nuclease family protein [Marinimicrobium sp. C6131]